MILSNLEYAQDPSTSPLEKRTFARNYRQSMTRIDAFIRTRKLNAQEVAQVNFVLKSRARRFIGAGRKEWLYPEKTVAQPWGDLRKTFLPPKNGLFHFGGEMFVKYESGDVHYQDEFGRTEKPREFLIKKPPKKPLRAGDVCGCGSGNSFKACCQSKPEALRPSWNERSIRERNLMLQNGIEKVLKLDGKKDWIQIRRELTDEQIKKIYLPRRRPRHGSTPRAENRRSQANSAAHPAADGIDRLFSVAANHLSNERHRASTWQAKTCPRKTSEMPIPPYYFAFRDRNETKRQTLLRLLAEEEAKLATAQKKQNERDA